MDIFLLITIPLILISSAQLIIVILTWKLIRGKDHNTILIDFIFSFILLKLILYYEMPLILRIISGYQFEYQDNILLENLVFLYFIELISWFFWILPVAYIFKFSRFEENPSVLYKKNFELSKFLIIVFTLGFIGVSLYSKINQEHLSIESLFMYVGYSSSPFLMMVASKYYNKKLFFIGLFGTIFTILITPSRGALIYTLVFCSLISVLILKSKKNLFYLLGIYTTLAVVYFSIGNLVTSSLNFEGDININIQTNVDKNNSRSALDEIEWRFGASTRIGTAFIKLYDNGKSAGINPIIHSLEGFLPRAIMADKPYPSTLVGDDLYSQGMYLIMDEIYHENAHNMVEFPTGAHFYWEFGIIGVIILSLISGAYVATCARLFSNLGLVSIPLTISTFKLWGFNDPKIWVSEIALQLHHLIIPLIILILIAKIYLKFMYMLKVLKLRTKSKCA